ncbi:hypothetical protein ACFQRB_18410 [Halobaculum litoreum]|uniref:Uncharacterized protein n=1 Tax=Halobaculum litoreum TaxID=3031998 RepID=A0ABD5XW48_9EURY
MARRPRAPDERPVPDGYEFSLLLTHASTDRTRRTSRCTTRSPSPSAADTTSPRSSPASTPTGSSRT